MANDKYTALVEELIAKDALKKAVISKYKKAQDGKKKSVLIPFIKDTERFYQLETFYTDGKARHINMSGAEAKELLLSAPALAGQINLITESGSLDVLVSSKGAIHISGRLDDVVTAAARSGHNKKKNYILDPINHSSFLMPLGICDEKGGIIEKKRSKFRQIERFLEIVDASYEKLPKKKELCICDLCCGKSYLTFALYYYLVKIKNRSVKMYGVDLKPDVIDFCAALSERLGFTGLDFLCGDVSKFDPEREVDAVVSLHACDIATDFVLAFAVKHKAGFIFSTPCCHHEMMKQINCGELSFITGHSLYAQKLCDAATDALRVLMLEANGYDVETVELIDPEETPKNVLIKAHYVGISDTRKREKLEKYASACDFLGVSPYLARLLENVGRQ